MTRTSSISVGRKAKLKDERWLGRISETLSIGGKLVEVVIVTTRGSIRRVSPDQIERTTR